MAKVFLGVGHGGTDCGAFYNGVKESDLNLVIALACRDELTRHGVTVGISRTKDENDSLVEEINECNAFAPDLAVEIHNNAGGGDGIEVFHTYLLGKGKTLAVNIIDEVVKIGQNSRGTKIRKNAQGTDYFGWIRQCKAPAVLVECAFIDTKDVQIIDTAEEQKAMGIAIAKGILKTLGIAWVDDTTKYSVTVNGLTKEKADALINSLKSLGYVGVLNGNKTEEPKTETKPTLKSIDEIAREVINGKWGNGNARKVALEKAGYNYNEVQKRVNQLL